MTAKSSDDDGKAKRSIKASAGAWWNTKVEGEQSEEQASPKKTSAKAKAKEGAQTETTPKPKTASKTKAKEAPKTEMPTESQTDAPVEGKATTARKAKSANSVKSVKPEAEYPVSSEPVVDVQEAPKQKRSRKPAVKKQIATEEKTVALQAESVEAVKSVKTSKTTKAKPAEQKEKTKEAEAVDTGVPAEMPVKKAEQAELAQAEETPAKPRRKTPSKKTRSRDIKAEGAGDQPLVQETVSPKDVSKQDELVETAPLKAVQQTEPVQHAEQTEQGEEKPKRSRRSRGSRGKGSKAEEQQNQALQAPQETSPTQVAPMGSEDRKESAKEPGEDLAPVQGDDDGEKKQSSRSRRNRRSRGRKRKPEGEAALLETVDATGDVQDVPAEVQPEEVQDASSEEVGENEEKPVSRNKRNRRNRGRKRGGKKAEELENSDSVDEDDDADDGDVGEQEEAEARESKWKNLPNDDKQKSIRLLINAEEPEECRLALLEDGRLQSLHVTTVARTQTKNNIYKAKIVAIEPNLQAAFVDYGTPKNGFLPFSEIHPEYYKTDLSDSARDLVENRRWKKLKIEDVMERGQELLVQVVKEEVGKKGANMTTYLSLPGRCVVLMPGSDSAGISRKIVGEEKRNHLRDIMRTMEIPEGLGWIVRTASIDITEAALQRDVDYLVKLWEDIRSKGQSIVNVGLVYEDQRSVLRFLREHFDPSIQEILVDSATAYEQVAEFVSMLPEAQRSVKVRMHKGSRPIFNQFSVEDQIESIYQPQVNLPSGGSIVIDPTEALVAIDVNSGSTSKGQNFEETIYQANMEAATELARQLRLRDLGGLVVVDFIDMRNKKHIRDVERQVKDSMKRDKAKVDFSRISKFGLMQISRQKLGSPLEAGAYRVCKHCKGRGTVRAVETLALFYLRRIQTGASRSSVLGVECRFPLDVASYLLNNKRQELSDLEEKYNVNIVIIADTEFRPAENEIVFHRQEKDKNDEK